MAGLPGTEGARPRTGCCACSQKECNKVVDKYVEMDSTLVFIDMVLQRKRVRRRWHCTRQPHSACSSPLGHTPHEQVYRHLLFNFIPSPQSGLSTLPLLRACLVLVLLEVFGRQYVHVAGRAPALAPVSTPHIITRGSLTTSLLQFFINAVLEGTIFGLAVLGTAWWLRAPAWWGGRQEAPTVPPVLDPTASRTVPGLPSDLLPWQAPPLASAGEAGATREAPSPPGRAAAAAGWQLAWGCVAALILGSFGRLACVLLMVWTYPPVYVTVIGAFVLLSQVTAVSAALDVGEGTAGVIVAVGAAARVALQALLWYTDLAPSVSIL